MWVSIMVVITLQPLRSVKEAADPTLATDVAKLGKHLFVQMTHTLWVEAHANNDCHQCCRHKRCQWKLYFL